MQMIVRSRVAILMMILWLEDLTIDLTYMDLLYKI